MALNKLNYRSLSIQKLQELALHQALLDIFTVLLNKFVNVLIMKKRNNVIASWKVILIFSSIERARLLKPVTI